MRFFLCLLPLLFATAYAQDGVLSAHYSVPVDPSLQAFAVNFLPNAKFINAGANIELAYDLPYELVGSGDVHFIFRGEKQADGSFAVKDGNGSTGDCHLQSSAVECHISYGKLNIDPQHVRDYILKNYSANLLTAIGKLQVARVFSTDPQGVVTIVTDSPTAL